MVVHMQHYRKASMFYNSFGANWRCKNFGAMSKLILRLYTEIRWDVL